MVDPAYYQRHGDLAMKTIKELGEMLAQKGYRLTRRNRKQDRVFALLYLEKWPVVMEIVDNLGLERVVT